jgi:hypothetical protein
MKKISTLLSIIAISVFTACTGPEGIPGRDGYDGLDGQKGRPGFVAKIFENNTPYNFASSNNYTNFFTFPRELYDSDVILVYRLVGVEQGKDVWKSLPETYFFDNGTRDFTYNFDFTQKNVLIKLFGNSLNTVADKDKLNQIFRIVIIPSDFPSSINKNNYLDVVGALKIKDDQIQEISF